MRKLAILIFLCATPAAAHDYWSGGHKVDPKTKAECCSGADTKQFDLKLLKPEGNGFRLLDTGEYIGPERIQPSPDGNVWVSRWMSEPNVTKCFFYPYSF